MPRDLALLTPKPRISSSGLAFVAVLSAVPVWLVGVLVATWDQVENPALLPFLLVLAEFVSLPVAMLVAYWVAPRLLASAKDDPSARSSVLVLVRVAVCVGLGLGLAAYLPRFLNSRGMSDELGAFLGLSLLMSIYFLWAFVVPTLVGLTVYLWHERRLRRRVNGRGDR